MEKYIQSAEEMARAINTQLSANVPEFKKLFGDYSDAYCKLRKTITTKSEEETLNELALAVRKHLNHTMLREIFALVHPKGRHEFFYLNNEYFSADSQIKGLAERVYALFPAKMCEACYEFINCYKKLMYFYEKEMFIRASKFINECYK